MKVCSACQQIEKHWDKLFNEVCIKYEHTFHELQRVQLQLSIKNEKQISTNQSITNKLRTKAQCKLYISSQTEVSTQTTPVKQTEVSTQTIPVKRTEESTQTTPVKQSTTEKYVETDGTYDDQNLETPPATPPELPPQNDVFPLILHDHSYADAQQKPFSCSYCTFRSARKYNCDKHEEICTTRPEIEKQSKYETEMLYECRVCKKFYPYDKLRKHYRQFIDNKVKRQTRNGHNMVSKETHELFLEELKANKVSI